MAKLGPSKQIHQNLPHFGPNSAGNGRNPPIVVTRKNRAPQGGKPLLSRLTMGEKPHLYLVDGSAYIFRAYHRLPPLTDPEGTPVGAVYGYTTMLWKLADDLDKADGPTHLAVVLDKSSQSFRNEIYDQYKANRPDPPEDLVPQFPLIRDATRAFSLPLVEEPDVEADDMIATYARAAQEQGWNVTIVSSDKDLMQLVGEKGGARIDMLDTMKNARIYVEEVEDKFGVEPEKVGDVLALMGDSVDNIPGIFGVGPKTASKLIAEHGDLTAAPRCHSGDQGGEGIDHPHIVYIHMPGIDGRIDFQAVLRDIHAGIQDGAIDRPLIVDSILDGLGESRGVADITARTVKIPAAVI